MISSIRIFSYVVLMAIAVGPVQALAQLPDFTRLAKDNSPAVVNISTRQNGNEGGRMKLPHQFNIPNLPEDSPFNDLFRHFFEGVPEMPDQESRSLGSGFVISEDGYILTNHHVVADADRIEVRFSDRSFYEAKVIGSDKASDIALIKIDAKGLPTVKIGSGKDVEVGEWVLAIGSPFGFDYSVTAGIVSATGRSLPSENYVPFIQTDVAINPGNSGGPLIDLNGQVVGVNSQIYSRTGGFMGLSFAIPIELAMNVAEQLRESGRVTRGYLGVLIQDVDRNLAESFGLEQPHGALVSEVMSGTPAEAAGLQPGDIIERFNGEYIYRSSELPPMVGSSVVGGDAVLDIIRNGRSQKLKVLIAQLPEGDRQTPAPSRMVDPDLIEKLGVTVTDLTPEAREVSKLASGGALVTRVDAGLGDEAGLERGDVIKMFNRTEVLSAEHLKELVAAAGGTVSALVLREGQPLFVAIRLDG